MNKRIAVAISAFVCISLFISGCMNDKSNEKHSKTISESTANITEDNAKSMPIPFKFRDVFGEEYETTINENIIPKIYNDSEFSHDGDKLIFSGEGDYKLGIDVSHHNGYVDWEKVKSAGYDFAILRIAFRGYGKEGNLNPDKEFKRNIKNAHSAGLDVGVYIFSQAINEEEAIEEAEYVISLLDGESLELPIVYDPESILDDEARTDNVTEKQFTANTVAFCDRIKKEGMQPMIYANMLWEAFMLDLSKLNEYPIWYADYESTPQTPYHFEMWQYTNEATVPGIDGYVDLNILIDSAQSRIKNKAF